MTFEVRTTVRWKESRTQGDFFSVRRTPTEDVIELFVHSGTGDDDLMDGTEARPYATLEKALSMVPLNLWGRCVTIWLKDGHAETIARPLYLPPILGGGPTEDIVLGDDPSWQFTRTQVAVACAPVTLDTLTGVCSVANTRTTQIKVTDASKAWTVNEHVGRILLVGAGESVDNQPAGYGMIRSNTATELFVCLLNGAIGNGPMRVCRRGATFTLGDGANEFGQQSGLSMSGTVAPVSFTGITFKKPVGGTGPVVDLTNLAGTSFFLCEMDGGIQLRPGSGFVAIDGCYLHDGPFAPNGQPLALRGSFLADMAANYHGSGGAGQYDLIGNYILRCGSMGHGGTSTPEGGWKIENCHIVSSTSYGIIYRGGNRGVINNCHIESCALAGVRAEGPGHLLINGLGGSANLFGVDVDSGVFVVATSADIAGTTGAIKFAGTHINPADSQPYEWTDLPLASYAGASARGCRLGAS